MCASHPAKRWPPKERGARTVVGALDVKAAVELLPVTTPVLIFATCSEHFHPACPVCRCVANPPVETLCHHTLTSVSCCVYDTTHYNTFTPASDAVLKVLGILLLQCEQPSCTVMVQLQPYRATWSLDARRSHHHTRLPS